jgi:hypothetical protein
MYCGVFLLIREPLVLFAQLAMRRDGGLSGSYQFHRLYEIRTILKSERVTSVLEFGSGASSILFHKYVEHFVSIEESESWAKHYLQMLTSINFLPGLRSIIAKLNLLILPRTEFTDFTGELVSSYELSNEISQTQFDLVYIDGPTSWIQTKIKVNVYIRDKARLLPNITVLQLSSVPRIIVIDGRRATVSYLIEKGGFSNSFLGLKGSYLKQPSVQPYHTKIYT